MERPYHLCSEVRKSLCRQEMQGITSSRTGRGRYFAVKDGSAEAVDQESRLEEILMGMEEDVDLGMAIMGMEEDLEMAFLEVAW